MTNMQAAVLSVGYTFPPSYLWYRGRSYTDSNGRYSFEATYPGRYSGRPIPHVHYKVFSNTGRSGKELTTQLYFRNDVPRSYQSYRRTKGTQFPQSIRATPNGRDITFDVVMDV